MSQTARVQEGQQRAIYAIHLKWLGLNHVNITASDVESWDVCVSWRKKAWTWEKYVAQHVKYHIILGNLMEYGYQCLDPGSKVNSIMCINCPKQLLQQGCIKISMRRILMQYCLSHPVYWQEGTNAKCESCLCWSDQTCQTAEDQNKHWHFKRMIKTKEYSREEKISMSKAQCQQFYELQKKAGVIRVRRPQKAAKL